MKKYSRDVVIIHGARRRELPLPKKPFQKVWTKMEGKGSMHNLPWRKLDRWDQNCIVKSIYFTEISLIKGEIKINWPGNVEMQPWNFCLLYLILLLCRRRKFWATKMIPCFTCVCSCNLWGQYQRWVYCTSLDLIQSLNLAFDTWQASVSVLWQRCRGLYFSQPYCLMVNLLSFQWKL